ncbi:IscS subfamily cysteine desulfurase [Candidatus Berkiella cookevillensis]|uniref:Cysteine desulfurase IscS n=1 Tax=Candidatus Berkiella cookevillensis TaxID=437022 RepID=A0A0Q9YCM5_9GAMM|nr:IscS subfamily cysteine desulfurase [Candidatus Berkiella cookevillensis]MCS5708726.1 IscS subfamily cysteine desulfurase [Candidatus Berkiella cookevillensis]
MSQSTIRYFDYAATTPIDPRVQTKMINCIQSCYGNPASRSHAYGWDAEKQVEKAREQVAALINADPKEIVFTSGATESNNLAIKGAAHFYHRRGKHIITSKTEHKAVLDTCRQLEREGFEVTYLTPNSQGEITPEVVQNAIREDTIIVSIMHVNNEIGIIQDIHAIGAITREKNIIFHVDAAQGAGKIPLDMESNQIDLLSLSGHKIYGPKGIGALYVRRKPRIRLEAQMHGGGHERGLRSGTLATHQIVGLGEACLIAKQEMQMEALRIAQLKTRLWDGISHIEALSLNGTLESSVPGIINFSINYVEGESLIMGLKDLAVSSGSACTSASLEPSYVLKALGLEDELAHSSLRFSIGRFTTEADVDYAIGRIHEVVEKLRALSPLWEMYQEGIDLKTVEWVAH